MRFYPVKFTPASSHYAGKEVQGIGFVVTNRDIFNSSRLGLELAAALGKLCPGKMEFEVNRKLIGNEAVLKALRDGGDAQGAATKGMPEFAAVREKYLLYR